MGEHLGLPLLTPEDIEKITHNHEKMVARFIFAINARAELIYEPGLYSLKKRRARRLQTDKLKTVPDFQIVNPDTDEQMILEVTTGRGGLKEPRRPIIENRFPTVPYVIFERKEMKAIAQYGNLRPMEVFNQCNTEPMQQLRNLLSPYQCLPHHLA